MYAMACCQLDEDGALLGAGEVGPDQGGEEGAFNGGDDGETGGHGLGGGGFGEDLVEVGEGGDEAFGEGDFGFPAQEAFGFADVGAAAGGVVLGEGVEDELGSGAGE